MVRGNAEIFEEIGRSNMSKWTEAAEKYRRKAEKEGEPAKLHQEEVRRGVNELEAFMVSIEGAEAMELLRASGRVVYILKYEDRIAVTLTGDGIKKVIGRLGYQTFGSDNPIDAVDAFIKHGQKAEELVPLIRKQVDIIADLAPDDDV